MSLHAVVEYDISWVVWHAAVVFKSSVSQSEVLTLSQVNCHVAMLGKWFTRRCLCTSDSFQHTAPYKCLFHFVTFLTTDDLCLSLCFWFQLSVLCRAGHKTLVTCCVFMPSSPDSIGEAITLSVRCLRPDRSCYQDISWTVWASWWNRQGTCTGPMLMNWLDPEGQGHSRPPRWRRHLRWRWGVRFYHF